MSDEAMNLDLVKAHVIGARGCILIPEIVADMKKSMSKPIINSSDMVGDMESEALDLCVSAIDRSPVGQYEAASKVVKEAMDKKFGATWHVVIGRAFAFDITYQFSNHMLAFYQGNIGILLYKC